MNEGYAIDIRLAVQQEVRTRQQHALALMLAGALFIIVTVASFLDLVLPVAVLSIFVLMFFHVRNQKEINRLIKKYEM